MNRYRSYGELDDQPKTVGDGSFIGVDEYNAPENIRPGNVQQAVNHDFTSQDGNTRGGFVCYPELGGNSFGSIWTYVSQSGFEFFDVAYGAGLYVAVGYPNAIRTSPDGITWTTQTSPGGAFDTFYSIEYANGVFVAVGDVTATSPDGITWTLRSPTAYDAVTYGNGKWVALKANTAAISTDNGATWSVTTGITQLANVAGVSYGNGVFTAVLSSAVGIVTSSNGTSWTLISVGPASGFANVAFGNQIFLALGSLGDIYTSSDALTWTAQTSLPNAQWKGLAYGNGVFIAVASLSGGDNVAYSLNGTQFSVLTSVPNYAWTGITFGSGKFVTVGFDAVMYSSNVSRAIQASAVYSDPNNVGETWIMLLAYDKVGFFANGRTSKTISLGGYTVTEQSTIVQANNYVYIFRGPDETPLYWDGNWNGTFALVPDTNLPDSFESIPNSNQATYYQNRLWVVKGKDGLAASDVLEFTDYDPLANEFNLNTGNSDYIVATYPFGQNSLVAFKNKSILLLQNVEGSLSDVTVTEITRQVGVVGINSVTSIGPDLAYVSNRNINLLTLTATNNALQHKILPLSTRIRKIMDRVNWEVGYKISLGYWNNKLYVALPLDNSLVCNAVVVYNFTTENWYGEWAFSDTLNMCIQGWQVVNYLGLQRMHAITEDGRIFVTDEGQNDISGTTVAEISTQLVTRAYDTDNLNHFQRRIYLDVATNRPKFSAAAFTEGASEESTLLTDQTYSRSETWKFSDSAYDLTNANDDYNRAYRKDYSTGPDSVQPGTGFEPEMVQEFRLPLITRRQGRLSWIEVTNTQGFISVMSLGYETRAGQRANLVQV